MSSSSESQGREPLAIVGMGCRFPGGATGPDEFWSLLLQGFDAIGPAPARVDLDRFLDPTPQRPGAVRHTLGGWLPGLEEFDARFFQISPLEAARLDPQQRLALMVSWEALENAGIAADRLHDVRTGVFFGLSMDDYGQRMFEDPVAVDPYVLTGGGRSFVSARVSYFLDLRGPSLTVDTACSSSLTAVHLACRSLRDRECELAIAGGVNVFMQPESSIGLSRGGMLAADGRCKSFDASADGFTRSEGAGVVVLKTLDRARADGDRIYALVRGTAMTCDGRASGLLLTPGQSGQEDVVRQACRDAGIDARRIAYVEAHGTGTLAGDPVEMASLAAVIGRDRDLSDRCLVGSVKSNVGHLEPAAGVAGLIKAVLALHHRTVPPNVHFDVPNPAIPWSTLPFDIVRETTPLARTGEIFASVNSFGLGGQNSHAVLQSAPATAAARPTEPATDRTHLIPLSAHTPSALQTLAGRLAEQVKSPASARLGDVAYTGAVRRAHHDVRAAIIAETRESLASSLALLQAGATAPSLITGESPRTRAKLVFVFSGQGAPWLHMGRTLFHTEPVFRRAIEGIERHLAELADWSLLDEMSRGEDSSRLDRLDIIQPYIFALQVGLTDLYRSWGIVPDATVGHSMGEAAAAYASGALSVLDALRIVSTRTQLINRLAGPGAMAVVALSREMAEDAIEPFRGRVSIGAVNSANEIVLSGDIPAIETIVSEMEARGVFARRVRVSCASHSRHMDPVLPELSRVLQSLQPRHSEVPFYSTVDGAPVDGTALDAAYWCRNLRQPVRLKDAIERLVADGFTAFLEVSHHPLLATSIAATLAQSSSTLLVSSLKRGEPERASLLRAAATLWIGGHALTPEAFAPDGGAFTPWPMYPWEPKRYWIDEVVSEDRLGKRPLGPHPLFGPVRRSAMAPDLLSWPVDLDPSMSLLDDHRVGGEAVLPATAYVEMMLAAAREKAGGDPGTLAIQGMRILEATVCPAGKTQTLEVAAAGAGDAFTVRISAAAADGSWSSRAECAIVPHPAAPVARVNIDEIQARCDSRISGDDHVAAMAARGIRYGPLYRGLSEIWRRDGESLGRISQPSNAPWAPGPYIVHPALLDVGLQVAVAALPVADGDTATVLPVGIDRLTIAGDPAGVCFSHAVVTADPEDGALTAQIRLLDAHGGVLIEVTGLRVERLDNAAASEEDEYLFSLAYRELAPVSDAPLQDRWVIAGEGAGFSAELAAQITAAGGECVDESWLSEPGAPIRGVICVWPLELTTPEHAVDCARIIPLVQAMADRHGTHGPLELVLVTRGAQSVPGHGAGAHNPVQSVMTGIGHVIAFEHAELLVRIVDLDPAGDSHDVSALIAELGADDKQDVVLRGGTRFAPRLAPFAPGGAPRLLRAGRRSFSLDRDRKAFGRFKEAARRIPKAGEVEIEIRFASLDGRSAVGETSAVGPGVAAHVGQPVLALAATELVARHAIVDARLVWPVPDNMAPDVAAIQPSAWLAAAVALGRPRAGESVRVAGEGTIAAAVRLLASRAGAAVPETGGCDVLVEVDPGAATPQDVAALRPAGRWATVALPRADGGGRGDTPPGPNRARVHIDLRALVEQSPEYARDVLDPILTALRSGELAPVSGRSVAAAALEAEIAAGHATGVCVEIAGAAQPIVRAKTRDTAGTWVVTGGFGGLGRVIAIHLVEVLHARGVVLAGRTAADPTDVSRLDLVTRLQRGGATVRLEAMDVADPDAVANLFSRLSADRSLPPLCGVVHAAGVLEDALLLRQDRAQFERVFAPKVQGAWNLHRATRNLDLDHFVLFSSLAGLFGNPGQANYAAANAYLDALAWDRARAGLPALSIGWGAWSEVGLVARQQDRIANMETTGNLPIAPELGARLFDRLLGTEAVIAYATRLDRDRLAGSAFSGTPHLQTLLGMTAEHEAGTLDRATVLRLTGAGRLEAISRYIRVQIGEVVRLAWTAVPEDQPLVRIGLDSLMAVAVRSRVARALGVTLPLVGILGGASPLDIARQVDDAIGSAAASPGDPPGQAGANIADEAARRAAAQLAAREQMKRGRTAREPV